MPLTQQLLLKVPFSLLGFLVIGGFVALALAGVFTVRHFIPHHRLKVHHDVADPILGALGAVYAVILAFVVVAVWQNFDRAKSNVQMEANYLADIYADAQAFTPEFRQKVSAALREYRQVVIGDEWRAMASGNSSPKAREALRQIWKLYTTYQPQAPAEKAFFEESVRKLNSLRELRMQRLTDARTGIHPLLWFVLAGGALTTVAFTLFFGVENIKSQAFMVVLLSGMIALILFTAMSLDFPFTGSVAVSPEPFRGITLE